MVGGMAGHTASFARMLERRTQGYSKEAEKKKDDEVYLESYAELDIHEEMLKDAPRVDAYRKAIEHYGQEWRKSDGISAIDVGSGTGLLAVLCSRAGARRVVAVEASRLAHFLRQVVEANVVDGSVEVKECRAEDLDLPEGEAVDVIVSEWMGYFLLFENMLPSVLSVRNRYLKPGGLMLPSRCRLLASAFEDTEWRASKLDFWRSVHGIDMSALVPLAAATACERPQHRLIDATSLLGSSVEILNLDLATVQEADLKRFEAQLRLEVPAGRRLDGIATWFECEFGSAGWLLSTSPESPATHWKQTVFHLRQPLEGGGTGIVVEGKVVAESHAEFSRGYHVTFDLSAPGRQRRQESFELR
eukprot:TRINITY_DN76765_c0_g1_i1.p1 TRINITY_DN76765_c0_g1~~TRINITY_DN76765_c0_g1_i1.p1  ORF type:complete len:396 (-),score=84.93 TRINITY_DN76765_c0_g1_i1:52-1131(-)